ncbi:MAG TPA: tetratricopeptide repeat protein [Nitratidesulfovibrio sp.]|nr:tetratricopeptide repeat protein [Nitratidesulfovibrio sp.]
MASNINLKLKQKQYESTVVEFITEKKGYFLVVSDDQNFISLLRNTVAKHLAIATDALAVVTNTDYIIKSIRDVSMRKKNVLVFMERMLEGRDTGILVRQVKNAYSDVKIIILTGETERQRLVLLHEIGADNFISKPISVNTLIEKIAFTIKPQGKLGQLIDTARAMVQQGSHESALKVCRKILELKPNSAAGLLVMGDAYQALGKMDRARECFEEASRNADLYLEPLKKLADLNKQIGDNEAQLGYLEKLDRLSPLNVERKVDMGEIHVEMGNQERAEELFELAVAQATREAMAYIGEISERIATIYSERDPERAERFLRKALDAKGDMLDRGDLGTFNRLGIALRKQGKWREATIEYQKALRIAPDDENLYYNMSMACAEGKEFREARSSMLKAMTINPDLPRRDKTIAFNMGLVFMRAGGRDYAERCLKVALELDPDFELAQQALERLGQSS